jgi:pyruvate,water dikinase
MAGAEQGRADFVVDLRDLGDRDADAAGTKAANLRHLAALGLRVPEGFVITTAACDRILATADNPGDARAGAGITQDVWAEVRSHLDGLGDGAVAVRSSGTTENLSAASYAGLYETVLGVDGRKPRPMP